MRLKRTLLSATAACFLMWNAPVQAGTVYAWLECTAQDSWLPFLATKTIYVTSTIFPVESNVLDDYPTGHSLDDVVKRFDMFMDGGSDFRGDLVATNAKAFREQLWSKERLWCAYGVVLPQGPFSTVEKARTVRDLNLVPKRGVHALEVMEFPFP